MAIQETQAFQVACDVCGSSAPTASDQGVAADNATKASFVSFPAPDGSPRTGATAWICKSCTITIAKLANV